MDKVNVSYARQSFKRTDVESSVTWQKQLIFEYADKNHYMIHHHFEDIKSGHSVKRPGLVRLQQLIKEKRVASLTVYRLDRLFRNYRKALEFFQLCSDNNIVLHSINDGTFNFKIPEERLALQILSVTAENQREQSVEHRQKNNVKKFQAGFPVNYVAPFGYTYNNHTFDINDQEAKTVRFIFDNYLSGKGYKKISLLTKKTPWIYRSPAQVRNIIVNPKYSGQFVSRHGILKDYLPRIVTQETFEQAQKIRSTRASKTTQIHTVNAKLRSKIICPYCGSKLTTYQNKQQQNSSPFYVCQKRLSGHYKDCSFKPLNLKSVEYEVRNYVTQFLSKSEEIKKLIELVKTNIDDQRLEEGRKGETFNKNKQKKVEELAKGLITPEEFKDWLSSQTAQTNGRIPSINVDTEIIISYLENNSLIYEALYDLISEVKVDTEGKITSIQLKGIDKNIIAILEEEYHAS